jgi:PIN domain nuclease of toxin-antitoxin system
MAMSRNQPLLIDTQVLIWMLQDSPSLAPEQRELLINPAQPLAISYFSLLELSIKASIGKLDVFGDKVDAFLQKLDIEVQPADRQVLQDYKIYNEDNKDPFDNLIITVAIETGYKLLTSDRKILATKAHGLRTLDVSG